MLPKRFPHRFCCRGKTRILERVAPAGSHVLLIGCGNGRDLIALAARGYTITAVEPSATAIREAQRQLDAHALRAPLVEGFFEDAPIPGTFDLVIFSYYCYALIPVSRRRRDALKKASALLKPGGRIVISHASDAAAERSPHLDRPAVRVGLQVGLAARGRRSGLGESPRRAVVAVHPCLRCR